MNTLKGKGAVAQQAHPGSRSKGKDVGAGVPLAGQAFGSCCASQREMVRPDVGRDCRTQGMDGKMDTCRLGMCKGLTGIGVKKLGPMRPTVVNRSSASPRARAAVEEMSLSLNP